MGFSDFRVSLMFVRTSACRVQESFRTPARGFRMPGWEFRTCIIHWFWLLFVEFVGRDFVAFGGASGFDSCISIVSGLSDICLNNCVMFVVCLCLVYSLGPGFCAQRGQPRSGISWASCRILVDAPLCNRLYKPPGGNHGWRFTASIQVWSNSWAGICVHSVDFWLVFFLNLDVPSAVVRSGIRCHGCAVLVVGTCLDRGLGTCIFGSAWIADVWGVSRFMSHSRPCFF